MHDGHMERDDGDAHDHQSPEQPLPLETLVAGQEQRETEPRERDDHRDAAEHADGQPEGREHQPAILDAPRAGPERPDERPASQRDEQEARHLRHRLEREVEGERREHEHQGRVLGSIVPEELPHEAVRGTDEAHDEHGIEGLDRVEGPFSAA